LSRRAGIIEQLPFSGLFRVGYEIPGGQVEEDGSTSKNCRKNNKSKFIVAFK
jgi:hypothetical protein